MKGKLLIVEDVESTRTALQMQFEREGFEVAVAEDGVKALAMLDQLSPDLIILDVGLPNVDGLEVCQAIRQQGKHSIGIVMISGIKKEIVDRVVGLEIGAHAYMTKPFEPRELLAQVRSLLRLIRIQRAQDDAAGWFIVDDYLRIHFEQRRVQAGGQEIELAPQEFNLLRYLAQRPGIPCARADLADDLWDGAITDQAISTCVARLRAKIEPDSADPRYILAVHRVGYRFRAL